MDELNPEHKSRSLIHRFLTLHFAHSFASPNHDEKLLLEKLQGLVTNIKWSPEHVSVLFKALLKRFELTSANDRSHLLKWILQMLHCIQVHYITSSWKSQSGKTLIQLVQDKNVTDEKLKECLADDADKTLDEIIEEIRQEKLNQVDENLLKEVRDIVSSVYKELQSNKKSSLLSGLKKDLLTLCQAAEKSHFRPRLTQMVSWCIMALSPTGRLIQVGTGEGKSCIVAMFAAFRAMRGENVDIMSSSPVLAERDLEEWRGFYDALKISVDCNINKQGEDLKKCYKSKVVYGTVEEFAGDWLQHHFLRKDIFGQRTFQCAVVDEVDSLMLDKGHHVVYLSSETPALQHLNPLLAFIWTTVNQYSKTGTNTTVGRKYPFHQVVLKHIKDNGIDEFTILQMAEDTGVLAKGSVREIRRKPNLLSEKTASVGASKLAEFFKEVERRFPSCQFDLHIINHNGAIEELNKRPEGESSQRHVSLLLSKHGFCQYMYPDNSSMLRAAEEEVKAALHFTPCELKNTKDSCYIPGFLSDLVTSKLQVWIKNAFLAQNMELDHEYVLEKHGIVPVDYSCTGVVENFMKWTDGLQQFLEMKHDGKLSDMTAITNYMSNVGMLQKYNAQIYGMSGTLGQQAEIKTLQEIYNGIHTCQIPSFKRRKLFEVEGVVIRGEDAWIEKVCDVVTEQSRPTLYRSRRAVLVICETIKRAKILHQALKDNVPKKKLYINNNMDNSAIFTQELGEGEVVIATNIAGRGTDLQVSDAVKRAGGLFVVQTFMPKNSRVEAQAFGRTARQGSPGSAQLIICSSHLSEPLQLLVSLRRLQTLFENMRGGTASHENLFVMHLRLYQESGRDEEIIDMLLIQSHIMSESSKSDSSIKIAKGLRNYLVDEGLSNFLECHIPQMKKKQELFSQYLEKLDALYKSSNNKPSPSDVSALNEFWGMWLLTKFSESNSTENLKNSLEEDLKKAMQKVSKRESPSSNLHHYTVYGSELQNMGELSESINMYTKAIQEDHCWAAVAYYNRAFASLMQQNKRQDRSCIDGALQDLQNALKSVQLYCDQLDVTYRCATQPSRSSNTDSDTRFDKHVRARHTVLVSFKANIHDAVKIIVSARDRGGHVDVKKNHFQPMFTVLIESLGEIEDCLTLDRVDPLTYQQVISQSEFDTIIELKPLKSLGLKQIYVLEPLSSFWGSFSSSVGSSVGSFVGSFVGSLVGSLVRSSVGSLVRSSVGSLVRSSVGSFVRSSVGSLVRSSVGSLVRSSVGSFVRSSVGSLVRSFIGSLVGSLVGSKSIKKLVFSNIK